MPAEENDSFGTVFMNTLAPPALLFFCNSILFISLFTRLPAIQESLQIDKAVLGFALLGAPIGTFLALPLAGRINDHLTPRVTAPIMLAICAVLTPLVTIMPLAGFLLCFFLYGFFRTIFDVSANMISTGIEQSSGTKVLSRSHGFWSVGLLVGTLFSGFFAERQISPFVQQSLAGAVVLIACLVAWKIIPRDAVKPAEARGGKRAVYVLPDRTILMICVMVFGLCIVEGAIYDWGIFFIREALGADPAIAGILYAGFTVGMGGTRLCGDRLRESFSPMILLRGSAVSVCAGVLLLVATPGLVLGGLALFLIGCGVALAFPLAVSTTIALGKGQPAENLAALALTLMLSTIGVPPLLGFVAEHFGLVTSFVILLPCILLSFLMAPVAEGRRPSWPFRRV